MMDEIVRREVAGILRDHGVTVGTAPLWHVAANDDGVCWSIAGPHDEQPVAALAAFRRAASAGPATAPADRPAMPLSREAIAAIAAKQMVRAILGPRQAQPPAGTVTFLNRRTLRTSTHNVTVHPYDVSARQRTQDEFLRDHAKLRDAPPLPRAELTRRWQRLADDRFGAFAGLDDTNPRQLPLKVTLARMSDPCGLLSAPPVVAGAGADRESARERAMIRALAAYASIVVDPRLLVDKHGAFLGPRDGDAARLLESVRDGRVDAFVRGFDLTDEREWLVPARRAFAVLRTPGAFRTPCGTSAALGWRQALTHGLLQHCVRLTVRGSSSQGRQHPTLAAEDFDHDPGVRYLATMGKAAGLRLTLRDITGPAGVPVVACTSTTGATVYGGGGELTEAVREALTAALLRYQWHVDPVLEAAIPAATSASWADPASTGGLSPDRLIQALTSLGYTPSVVALDHDHAVHEEFPAVLRVILERRPRA